MFHEYLGKYTQKLELTDEDVFLCDYQNICISEIDKIPDNDRIDCVQAK